MIPFTLYRVAHVLGAVAVLAAVAAHCVHALNGGSRRQNAARRPLALMHGVGLALLLVAGFGMLAQMGLGDGAAFPGWLLLKLALWLALGAAAIAPYRRPSMARPLLLLLPVLGALAAYLGLARPF
jgi:hypothetical protein